MTGQPSEKKRATPNNSYDATEEQKLKTCYKLLVKDYKDKLSKHVESYRKHGVLCDRLHTRCESLLSDLEATRLNLDQLVADHNVRIEMILAKYTRERLALIDSINEEKTKLDKNFIDSFSKKGSIIC